MKRIILALVLLTSGCGAAQTAEGIGTVTAGKAIVHGCSEVYTHIVQDTATPVEEREGQLRVARQVCEAIFDQLAATARTGNPEATSGSESEAP